jgi:DNA polymerase-3 subunit delta
VNLGGTDGTSRLAAHLNGPLAPIYAIHGDDPLLVIEAADAIRSAARAKGFSEREVLTVSHPFDWKQLAYATQGGSLFGDSKIVELRVPTGKLGRGGPEALQAILDESAATASDFIILMTLHEFGWREQKAAWFQNFVSSKTAVVIPCAPPGIKALPRWIAERLARQQQSAPPDALDYIARHVEGNLLAANQEVLKLGLLYPAGPLTLEQIQAAVVDVSRLDMDSLRAALLEGDLARFSRTLTGLREQGEALPLILFWLAEDVRALVQLTAPGGSPDERLRTMRMPPQRAQQLRGAAQRRTKISWREALEQIARLDRLSKGIGQGDPWTELAALALQLC